MKNFTFTKLGRALVMAAVMVVGAVCWLGCGGSKDSSSGKSESGAASSEKSGKLTDSRDGQKYRTVEMLDGKTWMAENLRYKLGDSWCYDNDESKCQQYGRLYDWKMAKKACPKSWHLPSKNDWERLTRMEPYGKKFKSTSGWDEDGNGTDEFGFSALPGGYRGPDGAFHYVGKYGYWWTATENGGGHAYRLCMDCYGYAIDNGGKFYGFSVRCVAD